MIGLLVVKDLGVVGPEVAIDDAHLGGGGAVGALHGLKEIVKPSPF